MAHLKISKETQFNRHFEGMKVCTVKTKKSEYFTLLAFLAWTFRHSQSFCVFCDTMIKVCVVKPVKKFLFPKFPPGGIPLFFMGVL